MQRTKYPKNILNTPPTGLQDTLNNNDLVTAVGSELDTAVGKTTNISTLQTDTISGNLTISVPLSGNNLTTGTLFCTNLNSLVSFSSPSISAVSSTIDTATSTTARINNFSGTVDLLHDLSCQVLSAGTIICDTLNTNNLTTTTATFNGTTTFSSVVIANSATVTLSPNANTLVYKLYNTEGTASVSADTWTEISFSAPEFFNNDMSIPTTVLAEVTIIIDWPEDNGGKRWITAFTTSPGGDILSGDWGGSSSITEYRHCGKWSTLTAIRGPTAQRTTTHFIRRTLTAGTIFHVSARHNQAGDTYDINCLIEVKIIT